MQYDGADTYTLASGKELYANEGILGLTPDLRLTHGYDGRHEFGNRNDRVFTLAERQEVAALMIARWHAWGFDHADSSREGGGDAS